jgi:GGDEF domain-containing protein
VLARLAGDEFPVLLPKADEAEAARVAEALAKAVRPNTALLGGERRTVTTSIGVALFNTSVEELAGETIAIEADLAMYDTKDAGGDGHAFSCHFRASRQPHEGAADMGLRCSVRWTSRCSQRTSTTSCRGCISVNPDLREQPCDRQRFLFVAVANGP